MPPRVIFFYLLFWLWKDNIRKNKLCVGIHMGA